MAPEQWPTNCARGRLSAAARISPSGTHSSTTSARGLRAAAERALDVEAGVAQRGGQGVAKPTGADDGAALRG